MTLIDETWVTSPDTIVVDGIIEDIISVEGDPNYCNVKIVNPLPENDFIEEVLDEVKIHYHCDQVDEESFYEIEEADLDGYAAFSEGDIVTVLCKLNGQYPERSIEPIAVTGFRFASKECLGAGLVFGTYKRSISDYINTLGLTYSKTSLEGIPEEKNDDGDWYSRIPGDIDEHLFLSDQYRTHKTQQLGNFLIVQHILDPEAKTSECVIYYLDTLANNAEKHYREIGRVVVTTLDDECCPGCDDTCPWPYGSKSYNIDYYFDGENIVSFRHKDYWHNADVFLNFSGVITFPMRWPKFIGHLHQTDDGKTYLVLSIIITRNFADRHPNDFIIPAAFIHFDSDLAKSYFEDKDFFKEEHADDDPPVSWDVLSNRNTGWIVGNDATSEDKDKHSRPMNSWWGDAGTPNNVGSITILVGSLDGSDFFKFHIYPNIWITWRPREQFKDLYNFLEPTQNGFKFLELSISNISYNEMEDVGKVPYDNDGYIKEYNFQTNSFSVGVASGLDITGTGSIGGSPWSYSLTVDQYIGIINNELMHVHRVENGSYDGGPPKSSSKSQELSYENMPFSYSINRTWNPHSSDEDWCDEVTDAGTWAEFPYLEFCSEDLVKVAQWWRSTGDPWLFPLWFVKAQDGVYGIVFEDLNMDCPFELQGDGSFNPNAPCPGGRGYQFYFVDPSGNMYPVISYSSSENEAYNVFMYPIEYYDGSLPSTQLPFSVDNETKIYYEWRIPHGVGTNTNGIFAYRDDPNYVEGAVILDICRYRCQTIGNHEYISPDFIDTPNAFFFKLFSRTGDTFWIFDKVELSLTQVDGKMLQAYKDTHDQESPEVDFRLISWKLFDPSGEE